VSNEACNEKDTHGVIQTPMRPRRVQLVLLLLLSLVFGLVFGDVAWAIAPQPSNQAILVRYRLDGVSAVTDCAERIWRGGSRYADATADRSESLDRWHERHDVRSVRALFRRTNDDSLARQTQALAERLRRGSATTNHAAPQARSPGPPSTSPSLTRGLDLARRLAPIYRVEIAESADLETALEELNRDPHVDFAQPDHTHRLDYDPDDPFLASSGSWSQPFADLWGLDRIGAHEAWQTTRGAGQIVAVVDTGLDYEHPDIAANVWVNPGEDLNGNGRVDPGDWNGLDDDGNGFVDDLRGYDFASLGKTGPGGTNRRGDSDPFDDHGHGTHVSGIVAATANNGIGIAGVAPEAKLMPLKGFPADGPGRDSDLWLAVLYAIENGAGVVNASWSCSPECPINPLAREILAIAESAGVVFVTSAGNRAFDVVRNDPENSKAAITVGSIGAEDDLSSFSNRGWLVDLTAPGGGTNRPASVLAPRRNILSLAASSLAEFEDAFLVGDRYWRQAGTSMAAPYVAGAVALLRSNRESLRPASRCRIVGPSGAARGRASRPRPGV